MSATSDIQWTEATWNPVRGCDKVSAGCKNCYAETFAERWRGIPGHPFEHGFDLRLVPEKLSLPLQWRRKRKIFVNSMSDLFHEDVPFKFIAAVFGVMAASPRHTFQVLTKRSARMRAWFLWMGEHRWPDKICGDEAEALGAPVYAKGKDGRSSWNDSRCEWPLTNVHLGISAETQETFDERWRDLKECPAVVRWASFEPLLGPVSAARALFSAGPDGERAPRNRGLYPGLDWGVGGGESGVRARSCDLAWLRSLVAEYAEADTPFFVKQLGLRPTVDGSPLVTIGRSRKNGDPAMWPKDLQVRQWA